MTTNTNFVRVLICLPALVMQSAHADETAKSETMLSVGATYAPRYLGSNENHPLAMMKLQYKNANGLFVDTSRGVGYGFSLSPRLTLGLGLGYDLGRMDHNGSRVGGDRLQGMGDVPASANAQLEVGYKLTDLTTISATVWAPVTHQENGMRANLSVNSAIYEKGNDRLSIGANAQFGSGKFNQTNFGVTDAQHQRTSFAAYSAKQGIYAVALNGEWTHRLSRNWSTTTGIETTRLLGVARASPIVESRTNTEVTTLLNYTF